MKMQLTDISYVSLTVLVASSFIQSTECAQFLLLPLWASWYISLWYGYPFEDFNSVLFKLRYSMFPNVITHSNTQRTLHFVEDNYEINCKQQQQQQQETKHHLPSYAILYTATLFITE